MHSANSSVCKAVDGLALLVAVCDVRPIVSLAFWVPREHNRVADFLSHLAHIHRSEVAGRFTPAQTHALAGAATGEPSQLSQPPTLSLSKFSTLQSAIASSKSARAKTRLARRYAAFAESADLPAFPVSEQSIALFLIHFVLATGGAD